MYQPCVCVCVCLSVLALMVDVTPQVFYWEVFETVNVSKMVLGSVYTKSGVS
jgi:hypothetical protein